MPLGQELRKEDLQVLLEALGVLLAHLRHLGGVATAVVRAQGALEDLQGRRDVGRIGKATDLALSSGCDGFLPATDEPCRFRDVLSGAILSRALLRGWGSERAQKLAVQRVQHDWERVEEDETSS